MSPNPFTATDRRFTNLESANVQIVRFRFAPVLQFLESVTSVFRSLDLTDEYQAGLGRSLWKLRCSVLFGLAPYNHKELELLTQGEQISDMAERLPGSRDAATQMVDQLLPLLDQTDNPKLEWIAGQNWPEDNPGSVFSLMAMRKSFGPDIVSQLPDSPLRIISSLEQIETGEHATLVIPGTCQYLSQNLFMKLFYLGEFSRIHVLLYEGESFRPKDRLRLPDSPLLPGLSEGKELQIERSDVCLADNNDVDSFIADGLFNPGSGATEDDSRGIPARFVLCDDGKGFHLAEKERIRVWRPNAENRLIPVYPAQLSEGDFVILEKSDRGTLLEKSAEAELNAINAWKRPLQALLLSNSRKEVAILMRKTGLIPEHSATMESSSSPDLSGREALSEPSWESSRACRNLQSRISNWEEERSYGPGDMQSMRALVQMLVESGHLRLDTPPEEVADRWFRELAEFRSGQMSAGRHKKTEDDHLLENALGGMVSLTDGTEIELDNGRWFSLHQLAMIGDRIRRVTEFSLKKMF